ncbi:MAG: hypothetical protein WD038_11780 [Balneolales bacterium]
MLLAMTGGFSLSLRGAASHFVDGKKKVLTATKQSVLPTLGAGRHESGRGI